ncbi:MAG: hypothetical protein LBS31_06990 [Candidatus Adiutrix sp.]|jgi:tetratricopeptide (TPR) repeat protein|nr:hypothetical protein [Candidatus Adiutrix sp.]
MLIFTVDENGRGEFLPADEAEFNRLDEELRRIVADLDSGATTVKKALKTIKAHLRKEPLFLRAQLLAGELHAIVDDYKAAEACRANGLKAAQKIIPEDFNGPLATNNIDVQCYLRCHAGHADALEDQEEYRKALEAARRHMIMDPGDIFERRRKWGELLILAGEIEEARDFLEKNVKIYPEAHYSLGYLALSEGRYASAAALLRRAFVTAPYAGDFLCCRPTDPNIFWEQGPQPPDYDDSLFYAELLGGRMWNGHDEALPFLDWLSQTSVVLGDRARAVALSERAFKTENAAELKKIGDERQALIESITEESSRAMVEPVKDPDEAEPLFPWRLLDKKRENEDDESECGCGCGA